MCRIFADKISCTLPSLSPLRGYFAQLFHRSILYQIILKMNMATSSMSDGYTDGNVGYFTFEVAWEVANKGK